MILPYEQNLPMQNLYTGNPVTIRTCYNCLIKHNNYCTFYILRHGETEWNVKGILQGHADSPLTIQGMAQAKILKEELKNIHLDGAFSSDSLRAYRTAEIVMLDRNLTIKTTQLLRERYFGKWEGKPYSLFSYKLKHMLNEFLFLSDKEKQSYKYPDMESDEEIVARFITFLRKTAIASPNKTLLIATHGEIMRSLLIHIGFGTYAELPPHAVSNSAFIKLHSDGVDFLIKETKGIIKE
ncbi:MAG TPA: histidine phosphatase family protein [Candidatus Sulfotelmatobacter sp.]|nr:histidine phosphatase family protein [Candidatus Sulfotelmatobacter sp.]